MPTKKKFLAERIAEKLEVFNNRLEAHVRRNQVLLTQMNIADCNERNAAFIRQYFHRRK